MDDYIKKLEIENKKVIKKIMRLEVINKSLYKEIKKLNEINQGLRFDSQDDKGYIDDLKRDNEAWRKLVADLEAEVKQLKAKQNGRNLSKKT